MGDENLNENEINDLDIDHRSDNLSEDVESLKEHDPNVKDRLSEYVQSQGKEQIDKERDKVTYRFINNYIIAIIRSQVSQ